MKTVKLECDVTYTVSFDCEVEVADDLFDGNGRDPNSDELRRISDQIVEAAKEFDELLEVDDVDWFVA